MSLLFNMISRFVIAFLPRSKRLLISWLQSPSAVILEPKNIKSATVSTVSPSICHEVMGPDAMILAFWMLSFKPAFSLFSLTFIKKLFSSSSFSALRVVLSVYLRLLIFLLSILIPACASSSTAFHMMYSAYKVNKQGNDIQPWLTPLPIWNQSVVPCLVLTVASWPAYRILRRHVVVWYSHPLKYFPQFAVIYTVKGSGIISKAEVDAFLEFSCFFYDSTDLDNLISGSSAFSKSSLNTWIHIQLKPGLENFEHYFASMWDEGNHAIFDILWHCPSLGLEWKLTFSSPVATAEFSKFSGILSAALSQHHLLEFKTTQLEFHHLH